MLLLRILSFAAGSFVAFAAPFLLLSEPRLTADGEWAAIVAAVLAVLLFGLTYFYIALIGTEILSSTRKRVIAATLIACQGGIGAWIVIESANLEAAATVAPLLCFSVLLLLTFVWPGYRPSRRGLRRRDREDAAPLR